MSLGMKIVVIGVAVMVFVVITMFPGFYPIRPLEPAFQEVCRTVLGGEVVSVNEEKYVGRLGEPMRLDYIQCGVDKADDGGEICYAPGGDSELVTDDCGICQYGAEELKFKGQSLGKFCKPYRKLWRWVYKGPF